MNGVLIVGESICALALAARLARYGHRVRIVAGDDRPWGGRLAATPWPEDPSVLVDQVAPVTTLPAAWRDLIKKSGRPMAGFLNAAGYALVEAPAALHLFPDGSAVRLPADRGGQVSALTQLVGRVPALAWAELIDRADELWQAVRFNGAERPFHAAAPVELYPKRTMAEWGQQLPDPRLRMLWLSEASRAGAARPETAPVLLASRWAMQRTFGRWQLRVPDGPARPLSMLVQALLERVEQAGVTLEPGRAAAAPIDVTTRDDEVVIDTRPVAPPPRRRPWHRPAVICPTPTREHRLAEATGQPGQADDLAPVAMGEVLEVVSHTPAGQPQVSFHRLLDADRRLITSHDYSQPAAPDPAWGWTIDSFEQWQSRPELGTFPRLRGGVTSHAGNEPWAELLTAALLSYQVHEGLTGADIRPTNRNAPRPVRPVTRDG